MKTPNKLELINNCGKMNLLKGAAPPAVSHIHHHPGAQGREY